MGKPSLAAMRGAWLRGRAEAVPFGVSIYKAFKTAGAGEGPFFSPNPGALLPAEVDSPELSCPKGGKLALLLTVCS